MPHRVTNAIAEENGRISTSSMTSLGSGGAYPESRLSLVHQLTCDEKTEDILWDLFSEESAHQVEIDAFLREIMLTGLNDDDPRISTTINRLRAYSAKNKSPMIPEHEFKSCVSDDVLMLSKIFGGYFRINDFCDFSSRVEDIYLRVKDIAGGQTPGHIQELHKMDPKICGVAVCSVDGQRVSFGDTQVPFTGQSTANPIIYSLAASDVGEDVVHQYVGAEPSGRSFNEITLDSLKRPHNPMINAGAIMTISMLKKDLTVKERIDFIIDRCKSLTGHIGHVGYNENAFEKEKETSFRNYALGYFMKEKGSFPPDTNLQDTIELYFKTRAIEFTAESLSIVAATLANGGICPLTEEKLLEPDIVRNTLSVMFSCGMYDYSGQFAFKVGVPAKSSVSGAIILVVPNVCGIVVFSPPLDEMGNSVRGVEFCKELVQEFPFHNFDSKMFHGERSQLEKGNVVEILFAASNGDVSALRRCSLQGIDLNVKDYDSRTALHIAACEGHIELVKFLVERCRVDKDVKDRWGFTAEEEAAKFNHPEIAKYLITQRNSTTIKISESVAFSNIV
jgi:glutaminase